MIPKIVLNEPFIMGDFEFKRSPLIIDPELLTPYEIISFKWDPEMKQIPNFEINDDQLIEIVAEKLKQDYIKFVKKQEVIGTNLYK